MNAYTLNDIDYERILREFQQQLSSVETALSNITILIRLSSTETISISNPIQLRKTFETIHHREKREKREKEKRLEELRQYFQSQNMISQSFDPSPYEIPHSDTFADMLDEAEYA